MLMHQSRGMQYFYRVIDYTDSYNSVLFQVTLKLIQSKDVGKDKYGIENDINRRGLII